MAKKVYDAVATVGKYNDRDGNEKKRYLTVGAVFEDDKGRLSMKIEAVPVGGEWNGWISFYEPKERGDRGSGQRGGNSQEQRRQEPAPGGNFNDFDDDIPF